MNKWCGIGRLTKDPEISYTQKGTAVARFSLAIDRRSAEKATDYIQCVAMGKTAEVMEKYIAKGDQIGVEGSIQTGNYKKDGKTVYTWNVFAESVTFTEKKKGGNSDIPEGFAQLADEDIPFS